jgi:hypothetical protein
VPGEETRFLSPAPNCVRCGETIGVYGPVVHVGDSLVRWTSRAPSRRPAAAGSCYRESCYDQWVERPLVAAAGTLGGWPGDRRREQPARWRVAAAGLLSSQTAQALRAELPSLIVWLAGTAAFAVIVGLISKSVAAAGSPDTSTGGR